MMKINNKLVLVKDSNYTEEDKSYDEGPQTGQD